MKKFKFRASPAFIFFASLGALWRLIFIFRDMEHLVNFPLIDDSFYSLGLARNLALGLGFTHDGVIQTNGFQPLFVFLSAPLYYIFPQDRVTPVYIVLFAQTILAVITGYIIYRLIKKKLGENPALFASFLWFLPVTMFKFDINGLETGLYAFFLMLSVYMYVEHIRDFSCVTFKSSALFGVVLGLTVLSRNDAFFLIIAFIADFILLHKNDLLNDRKYLKETSKKIGLCKITFIIVIFPWFYSNAVNFGSIIPRSGEAVRILSQKFLYSGNVNYFDNPVMYCINNLVYSIKRMINQSPIFEPMLWFGSYTNNFRLAIITVFGMLGSGGLFLFLDRKNVIEFWNKHNMPAFRFAWIYSGIMVTAYSFFVFGQHHFPRYYYPIHVVFMFVPAFIIRYLCFRLPKFLRNAGVLVLAAFFIVVNIGNMETYKFWDIDRGLATYFQTSSCRRKHIKEGDLIAAFQSGALAYFSKNRVINLDGVVNTEASKSIEKGTMLAYIKSQKIDYIIDVYSQYRALLGKSPEEMVKDKENFELMSDCNFENKDIRIFKVIYLPFFQKR